LTTGLSFWLRFGSLRSGGQVTSAQISRISSKLAGCRRSTSMDIVTESRKAATSAMRSDTAETHLHGRRLIFVRVGWVILVALTVSISVASLPENFAQQQTICSGTACAFWHPPPATVQALHALHLSFSSYATFSVLLRVVSTLLCIGVALVIVRH